MGKNIIIIHPGSLYVRMGRASDLNPVTILHGIARKQRPGGIIYNDTLLPATLHRVWSILLYKIYAFENTSIYKVVLNLNKYWLSVYFDIIF